MSSEPAGAADPVATWRRVGRVLLARPTRRQGGVAVLCGLLAFALVTQVHATSRAAGGLAAARPDDLVGILADLDSRAQRLRGEINDLQATQRRLTTGSDAGAAALREARARERTLGILTGTLAAAGPGLVLTVSDPRSRVHADVLVDAIEELRDAGAEAMQLAGVRVVASTAIVDDPAGGVDVDGTRVTPPYRLVVVGQPRTLAGALAIPGGVLDTVNRQSGADARVLQSPRVTITALRPLRTPRYARPAGR